MSHLTPAKRCWAEIDLAALERNLFRIRSALPSHVKYVAVVKADAYGHGFQQTVARLMQAGIDIFAVANVREALELEEIGAGWPILILSPILPDEAHLLSEHDWMVTVSSLDEVQRFHQIGMDAQRPISIHLKIDTGMGRLGVWHTEALHLIQEIRQRDGVALRGVFTHFSSADSDPEYTQLQRDRMLSILREGRLIGDKPAYPGLMIHADNSAAMSSFLQSGPFNAVRIGLLQFGIQPIQGSAIGKIDVEPIFSFHTRIALIKNLPEGTPVSYGRTCILTRDSRVAILAAGYADGVPFRSNGHGEVLIRGQRCPILGRVTMDQTIVDITDLPTATLADPVLLIGKQGSEEITLEQFSRNGHTIPWESLTSITKRVDRVYRTARIL